MKTNSIIKALVAVLILLLVHSCALPKVTQKDPNKNLPTTYQNEVTDSVNSAKADWKTFFEDPALTNLIDEAVVNNKEVNIMLQKIMMSQNEIQTRKGEYLPFVNLGAGAEVEKVGRYTRNGAVEENLNIRDGKAFPDPLGDFKLGATASWELDIWKKLRNAKKAAVLEYLATTEGKNLLVTNLVSEVARSYYELVALDNELQNLNQNIEIQENALEVVKLLKEGARTTSLAVKRFQAEVQKNKSEVYLVKQEMRETENEINFLLGRTPQPIVRNATDFIDLVPKIVQTGIPSQLLQNRPDVRQAELELAASRLNIKVAKADFYPSIGIKAGVGFNAFNPKFLLNTPESLLYSAAADIMAPLVNRNAIKAAYKNANSRQIQAAFEYEQQLLNAYKEVANQVSNLDYLVKSYNLKEQQVQSLTESIEIANQLFQYARADYMEVLLTQRDALEARKELIHTKKEQMIATVDLYKALGGGWR
ncbi:TolC family protein [Nonlabens sp. Asnod3-A02]|uniref:TolC family protein n=1 Tax=Nonlabens sp. Asnod3-A02 TaxID=3160579 RepID=UPI00386EBD38